MSIVHFGQQYCNKEATKAGFFSFAGTSLNISELQYLDFPSLDFLFLQFQVFSIKITFQILFRCFPLLPISFNFPQHSLTLLFKFLFHRHSHMLDGMQFKPQARIGRCDTCRPHIQSGTWLCCPAIWGKGKIFPYLWVARSGLR